MSDQPRVPPLSAAELEAADSASESSKARAEVKQFAARMSAEEIQKDAEVREHGRNQRFREQFEWLAIASLWISAVAILLVGGVWFWHLLLPERWRWLKADDVSHLQSIVTAGLLVGVIGNHFRKRLG